MEKHDKIMEQNRKLLREWLDCDGIDPLNLQIGGDHYKKLGIYQPWEVLSKWLTPEELRGFAKGTAIVYLVRERDKGQRLDIEKAMHTLQIYLELERRQRGEGKE